MGKQAEGTSTNLSENTNPIEQELVVLRDHIESLARRLLPVRELSVEVEEGVPPSNTSCAVLAQIQGADSEIRAILDTLQV